MRKRCALARKKSPTSAAPSHDSFKNAVIQTKAFWTEAHSKRNPGLHTQLGAAVTSLPRLCILPGAKHAASSRTTLAMCTLQAKPVQHSEAPIKTTNLGLVAKLRRTGI